ncbi:structural maintenance of chromosomes 6 [Haemaphysalis longicornis]
MIKLKDQRWALATEVCLGRHLYSYLVDNDQDAKTLRQIMTKVMGGERKPAIITSAFNDRVYDYRSNAVQSQYVGLLENLDIEDADVINCLLDQRRVENVALIESNHEARTVLMRESTVPRNCREVITLQGDQVYPAPDFRYYSSSKQRAELLKEGVDDQIREKKAELAETEGRLRDLEAIVRGQQEEAVRARKERSVVGAEVAKLQRSEASLGHKIKELASIEDPPPTNVSMLEAALQEMHDEMSRFEEQLASVKANEARIREELKVHTAKLREIDNSRAELLTASNSCKAKLLEADERTQKLQSQKKSFEEQMRAIDQRQTLSERQLKAFGEVIETLTEEAAKVAPERLHSRKKVKAMEAEIQALESQLALEEQRRGSREEICKQYNTAKEKYEKAKAVILELRTFLHKMKAMTVERQNKYVILCQQTVLRLRLMFSSTLIQQNFTGSLDFDHDRETLHIRVEPRKDRAAASGQSAAPQDLKALSGGERSFSTVCFVLALWDTMECPFRIMDEFDIFMDMGKRRVSLEMILEMTKRKSGCQFVFLTPLEMPSIKALQDVNIMIMPEPSRKRKGAALNGTTANNHHHNPGDADKNDQ